MLDSRFACALVEGKWTRKRSPNLPSGGLGECWIGSTSGLLACSLYCLVSIKFADTRATSPGHSAPRPVRLCGWHLFYLSSSRLSPVQRGSPKSEHFPVRTI